MIRNREQWGEPGSQEAMVQAELSFGYLACLLESGELEFPLAPTIVGLGRTGLQGLGELLSSEQEKQTS